MSGLVFFWLLTAGTMNPIRHDEAPAAGFYDAQVHAWFDGHWDVPRDEASIESFVIDGRNYVYFGPWPALLRVPVLAFTDSLDHDLAGVSMTIAFAVALSGAAALSWRTREVIRGPDEPFSRRDAVAAGAFTVLLGGGTTILWLAGRAWAYEEALLWAVATALWSFAMLVEHLLRPSWRALALASLFATLSFSSRGPVGAAPVVALCAVAGAALLRAAEDRWRARAGPLHAPARWFGLPEHLPVLGAVAAVIAPVVAYTSVNFVKFGSLFRLPIDSQLYINQARPARVAALEANGGSLFGLKFLPTNLLHYFRPDAFDLSRVFPFFYPPRQPPTLVGDVVFDGVEPAASLTVTAPLLLALAAVGIVVILRRRAAPGTPGPAVLRPLVLGGALATLAGLSIAWNTQRYQGDLLPLLVVTGLAGLHHLLHRRTATDRSRARPWPVWAKGVALAGLGLALAVFMFLHVALGLFYQRTFLALAVDREGYVAFQQELDDRLFGDRPPVGVQQGVVLPAEAAPGDLYVFGACDGLYQSIGSLGTEGQAWKVWVGVERRNETGFFRLTIRFPDRPPARPEPLLVSGRPGNRSVLAVDYLDDGRARLAFGTEDTGEWNYGESFELGDAEDGVFELTMDQRVLEVRALLDDHQLLRTIYWRPEADRTIEVGEGGFAPLTAPRFSGEIDNQPVSTPVCDLLLRRLRAHG